jgi:hypothetical protein
VLFDTPMGCAHLLREYVNEFIEGSACWSDTPHVVWYSGGGVTSSIKLDWKTFSRVKNKSSFLRNCKDDNSKKVGVMSRFTTRPERSTVETKNSVAEDRGEHKYVCIFHLASLMGYMYQGRLIQCRRTCPAEAHIALKDCGFKDAMSCLSAAHINPVFKKKLEDTFHTNRGCFKK